MTGRVRKPTARALDAAQSRLLASSVPQDRKQSSSSSAAVKRNGRAVNAKGRTAVKKDKQMDHQQVEEEEEELEEEQQEGDQDLTLYCVCLGYDTGEEAMIQCEHCSNWFHFGCIGITEDLAASIEGYACEMCQQMGLGTTRMLSGLPPPPSTASTSTSATQHPTQLTDESNDKEEQQEAASDSEDEEDQAVDDDDPMGEDEDGDYEAGGGLAKKRKKQNEGRAGRAARRRKVQNDEVGEGDYQSESDSDDAIELEDTHVVRKKPKTNRRSSTTPARPTAQTDSKTSAVPQSEKTRAAVVKQFTTTFSSIYSASTNADAEDVAHRATSFAQAVEEELFSGFCEPDDKGVRAPRAKYTSKFRSLQFNLKTNAVFRSRIANDDLDAAGIVNISAEDLQTPELKAMAESVRAASLKNSVKEAMAAPTAKRTHKGEEEMENNSARLMAEEEAAMQEMERKKSQAAENAEQRERNRERSASISQADSPFPDESRGAFPGSPAPGTPSMDQQDSPSESFFSSSSASRPRPRHSLTGSSSLNLANQDGGFENETMEPTQSPSIKQGSPFALDSPAPADPAIGSRSPTVDVKNEAEGAMSPPPQPRHRNSSTSIDMAAIWGKAKAASPSLEPKDEEEAMEGAEGAGGGEGEQKYESDLFNFEAKEEDDDFEDALFRSEGASPVKKTPRPPAQVAPAPKLPAISELPPVWAGDLIITDEGGFPAFGVQVGGRPVGTDHKTWQKLLPRGLQTAGRISTHQASKYLVDCSFAPTRELSIIALLPDTTGPSEHFPHKPTGDRCIAKHSHIFEYYLNKDRIGVVQAPKELSNLVKDIYIIPLPRDHPLPEYVELLDEHVIPESGKREQNLLLCVLVLQKGVLPTIRSDPLAPSPSAAPPISSSNPPAASPPLAPGQSPRTGSASPFPAQGQSHSHSNTPPPTSAPPIDPASFQSLLTSVDPTTLQSLLSNPQTLSALTSAQSQAALNVAHSQPSLPLSAPTGPRSGPPIHPSRMLAQQSGLPIDPNAYSGGRGIPTGPRSPHGPNRDGYSSQHAQFETNLTGGSDPQAYAMGDGGWQGANQRGGRGGNHATPRGGGSGRGRGGGGSGGGYGYNNRGGYGQGGY